MRKTLLEIVQDILGELDSDSVNDIDDTVESNQVADIVRSCYFKIISNRNWPHNRKLIQLDASGDTAKPNYLKLPDNLKELSSFKYEKQKNGDTRIKLEDVKYMHPDEFLSYISQRNSDLSTVDTIVDFNDTKLLVFNDAAPMYWTSFDDVWLVTDSYDNTVDTTLQKSKSQCLAFIMPPFPKENDSIPDLPIDSFTALIEDAKSTAFYVLKQMVNQKAEGEAQRQQRWLSRKSWRAHGGVRYPNYGRK
jgi:hypothetical protein